MNPHSAAEQHADAALEAANRRQFLGHPAGLFLLFLVEMWERFSYYGMRGLLVLYLTCPTTGMTVLPPGKSAGFNPGRGWNDSDASTAYGWYTGMAYLTPIVGGMIADKLIGTHRSMIVGGLLIALGHIVLGISGTGTMDQSALGMSVFVFGLALIVIGTGHFKPSVSVMVGQLYKQGDPRRETAFGIFYMGINLGAAIQTYICGTLGERYGWHWGFAAAAVGMLLGLFLYMIVRPKVLSGIGVPPDGKGAAAPAFLPIGVALAGVVGFAFHQGWLGAIDKFVSQGWVVGVIATAAAAWAVWYIGKQKAEDRGPVASIFIFMLFNAVFWLAFEQAGSTINVFTDRNTERSIDVPAAISNFTTQPSTTLAVVFSVVGLALAAVSFLRVRHHDKRSAFGPAAAWILPVVAGLGVFGLGVLKLTGQLPVLATRDLVPTTWFQSINPWLIIAFAPVTGVMWTWLARRNANPSQPVKIGMGLVLVGLGYLFMMAAAKIVGFNGTAKAGMFYIFATYFVHTMGEIILSPTGLSYVTKTAPRHSVSLLMGIWFVSSFIANLGAGKVAAMVEPILKGEKKLPWHLAGTGPNGENSQTDFFFLFVLTSVGAGLLVLVLTPLLKKLMRNPND